MRPRASIRAAVKISLSLSLAFALSNFAAAQQYQQTNLVSDIQGLAPTPDSHLLNPWGLISSPTSPWWVSDNNDGVSTLYNGNTGAVVPLVVNIPPIVTDPNTGKPIGQGTPTGVVFSASSGFQFDNNGTKSSAIFSFVTEDGTISAWPGAGDAIQIIGNSTNPSAAQGAVYKGATIAQNGNAFFLYVTNFRAGRIEIYDTNFKLVTPHDADAFRDHKIPRDFAPFNVQEVNGGLYVTYAKQNSSMHDDFDFPGLGFVDKFSPDGKLLQRLEQGPWLNAPWGVALAPGNFGFFSNHLLIGNAGSGQIAVYDADSGHFDGMLRDQNGHAIQNQRLWALRFGNGAGAGPTNTLFFTAGITDEADGLFGTITNAGSSAPEDNSEHK